MVVLRHSGAQVHSWSEQARQPNSNSIAHTRRAGDGAIDSWSVTSGAASHSKKGFADRRQKAVQSERPLRPSADALQVKRTLNKEKG